ncbi:MAG: glycosyltransferase family 2 protein [Verrucomicrobiia bacterium]
MLSLAMIVKNEERCLTRCLESMRGVADEIVVVDTGSTDQTKKIAAEHNARIFDFQWVDDFSAARNFALERSQGDWILVLDADEWVSAALGDEMKRFIGGPPQAGRLRIVSTFLRNGQMLQSQAYVTRLFPRGCRFEGRIHEQLVSSLPRTDLMGELWHDGYLHTNKSGRNIPLLVLEGEKNPGDAYWLYQLASEYRSLDKTSEAVGALRRAYSLLKQDDNCAPNVVVDYLYCLMESKQFAGGLEVIENNRSLLADYPDFHFVSGLFFMNLVRSDPAKYVSYLPQIETSYRRCLELGESEKYRSVRGTGSFLAMYNLGVMFDAFGQPETARKLFEQSAALGYEPARQLLSRGTSRPSECPNT